MDIEKEYLATERAWHEALLLGKPREAGLLRAKKLRLWGALLGEALARTGRGAPDTRTRD